MKTYQIIYIFIGVAIFLVCNYFLTTWILDYSDGTSAFDDVVSLISSASIGVVITLALFYFNHKREKEKA